MTSVQAELSSARLIDEPKSASNTQAPTLSEVTSDSAYIEIAARLGGRFSADLAAILQNQSEPSGRNQQAPGRDRRDRSASANRQRNTSKAHIKLDASSPVSTNKCAFLANISVVPQQVNIDTEAGRIARVLGQFGLFRAWAYAQAADNGDGWIDRKALETLWRNTGIAHSPRHARRLIQTGTGEGYWTQDTKHKRLYLTGQIKVAAQLVRKAIALGKHESVGTNLPGRRRVAVNLAGSLQEASAKLYTAWLVSKERRHSGTMISRETLCNLWGVSVPTLLTWERIAGINSHANYAQQNDTAIDRVPEYTYLTLNSDGSYAAAWRLPNTYTVADDTIQQHAHTGKAKLVRQAAHVAIAQAEQRGSIGDTASLRSDRRYFLHDAHSTSSPFRACEQYLCKLGRCDGDLSQRRYFYIGQRHGVRVFEAYNLRSGVWETNIHQRLIWQEGRDEFVVAKTSYSQAVQACG